STTVTRTSASSTPCTASASTPSSNAFMPQRLIKDRAIVEDNWTLVRDAASIDDVAPPVVVPLSVWKSRRGELASRVDVAVWLAPGDDPADLADDVATLPLIAVDFPQFTDGRGYSTGRL